MLIKLPTSFAILLALLTLNIAAHADFVYQFSFSYEYGIPQTLSWEIPTTLTYIGPNEVQYQGIINIGGAPLSGTFTSYATSYSLNYFDSAEDNYFYIGGVLGPGQSNAPDSIFFLGSYLSGAEGYLFYPDGYHSYLGSFQGTMTVDKVETASEVPEPPSLLLFGTAVLGSGVQLYRRKLRRSQFTNSAS